MHLNAIQNAINSNRSVINPSRATINPQWHYNATRTLEYPVLLEWRVTISIVVIWQDRLSVYWSRVDKLIACLKNSVRNAPKFLESRNKFGRNIKRVKIATAISSPSRDTQIPIEFWKDAIDFVVTQRNSRRQSLSPPYPRFIFPKIT